MASESNPLAVSKVQEGVFERGFKSWCENTAESIRQRMNLGKNEPISPYELAKLLNVKIIALEEIPGIKKETVEYLSSPSGDEWSAVTVQTGSSQTTIVNPRHSEARQASNITHELAHIIRAHKAPQIHISGDFAIREFDVRQEAEADWFAGCLLLPRTALISSIYRGESIDQAAQRFGVSKSLFNYRLNKTGVKRQFSSITT